VCSLLRKLPKDPFLVQIAREFSLEKMLKMTDKFYAQRVVPLMYNHIKEKKYFQRNAAIAIGNMVDPEYVPHLIKSMADAQELVRGYAARALGKIGGAKARNAL
jgi:epoxyqueuosine reductase